MVKEKDTIKSKYDCEECGTNLILKKESGYLSVNSKCKNISLNGTFIKLKCKCGAMHEIKIIDI